METGLFKTVESIAKGVYLSQVVSDRKLIYDGVDKNRLSMS